jgi:predicted CXXCH cytochrome family protein
MQARTRAVSVVPKTVISALAFLAIICAAGAVEHPGVLHDNDNCSSCHLDKTRGRSVHSAMAIRCTICHLAQTQGDLTTLSLMMPKDKICFACHQDSTAMRRHTPAAAESCLECHDAHSSSRPMLLVKKLSSPHL